MMNPTNVKPNGDRAEDRGFDLQSAYLVMIRAYLRSQQRQIRSLSNKVKHGLDNDNRRA
jgi:hypothetical protein